MAKTFLVIAEAKDGKLRQVSLETIKAAKESAVEGDTVTAALLGNGITSLADELSRYGANKVYALDDASLEHYNPEAYLTAIQTVLDQVQPDAIYTGHTAIGKDLAPMIAALLDAGQLSDVTSIRWEGDQVFYTRPIYAGKAFETKVFQNGPYVVTVRPNNIPAAEPADAKGELVETSYSAPSLKTVIQDVIKKTSGKIDLSEAKVVVSGGRGVKSADGFKPLEELADILGGAVGASRGACDAGYCDYSLQIGQTGKVVTPELYIACGISGAIQHLAGMSQSKVIIAINKDPEAPIFKVADYGIVGDLFEVVPLLIEEFKQASPSN
ncbi:electron transfer flavoprotein subunit alpha/FixB family protein [Paenibacillus larvae]|uniref:Electron transfer flavoprotein subunit alpha n=4 Tax=Paenibacillus larvae TaxID=1464 RepID=V9W8D2_9BACL|nr:electron transfer flavoprotein subunit alpha/FixB family protein [Paenibacillus larvae]AHD05362.1 electron transfer flavoprotein subunit alpha [Paenibacillus larvae subsp. larvae DSM 25430]AQR77130.1 electron transfer flavoprotein subunit alpha [Paenibacillus larvae subsp. larvae]AQZ48142.1 electron transfer flavoprotein subunit alpha [Paenibacillus larvae subsp. pulvifaciens]ARF66780.1 electron transfer flavoprotein subunit alpha [Paenibacillus larvae subsp. pulvifaciens]AVF21916.1 electro